MADKIKKPPKFLITGEQGNIIPRGKPPLSPASSACSNASSSLSWISGLDDSYKQSEKSRPLPPEHAEMGIGTPKKRKIIDKSTDLIRLV